MKKVSNKLYKARKIMDYTGVVFLVLLLLFIWQLYRGPVAVPFLKPYIIKALNHDDSEYQVTVDAVNLELVRSIQPIKIIANNVVYKKNDGTFIINAPKTSVSFSIRALLRGLQECGELLGLGTNASPADVVEAVRNSVQRQQGATA